MPQTVSLAEDYDKALAEAKRAILAGKALVYPTDTLYGLGCSALDEKAVAKIHEIKKREGKKPLSMLVFDYGMLRQYCEVSPPQEKILHGLLPGPYTFILGLRKSLPVSETMEGGIRVPEHRFMRQVSRELGVPIVSTSANFSGGKDAAALGEVDSAIAAQAGLIIDGGRCQYGTASTVIDLLRMKILRKGAVREGDRMEF